MTPFRHFQLPKLTLEKKVVLYFLLVSLIPLFLANIFWFYATREEVLRVASAELNSVAQLAAKEVDLFIATKYARFTTHAQTPALLSGNREEAAEDLRHLLLQDPDIDTVSFLDEAGTEQVKLSRSRMWELGPLIDQSSSTAFRVTTFLSGGDERYASPVYTDDRGEPMIEIALPIRDPELQSGTASAKIHGVLKANIHLHSLIQSMSTIATHRDGYVIVVDEKGSIVYHPRTNDAALSQKVLAMPQVQRFLSMVTRPEILANPSLYASDVHQGANEYGKPSLVTHVHTQNIRWGVVAQEPLTAVLSEVQSMGLVTIVLVIIFLILVLLMSLWVASTIVHPILQLSYGSMVVGQGKLDYRLQINTGDEVQQLGETFNTMANNLSHAFSAIVREKNILAAERKTLQVILSGITDAVIAVDHRRRILLFNTAAETLTGLRAATVLDRPLEEVLLLFEKDRQLTPGEYCPLFHESATPSVVSKQDITLRRETSKSLIIHLIAAPIPPGSGVTVGCILTLHDTSKERELEDMKLDFVSMAAHELRTPLTAIRGYLSLFLEDAQTHLPPDQLTMITRVDSAASRLSSLVQNLLNVSRIERGAFTMAKAPVDWVPVVHQVVDEFQAQAKEKSMTLSFETPSGDIPHVEIDKLRMMEVVSNLIGNALVYTPVEGTIIVRVTHEGNSVVTHIQDTGQGIPAAALPNLFSKFFRVGGNLEQGSKGTGLGLFISKEIVTMHGGEIWVDSVEGKGSTFHFSIPIPTTS